MNQSQLSLDAQFQVQPLTMHSALRSLDTVLGLEPLGFVANLVSAVFVAIAVSWMRGSRKRQRTRATDQKPSQPSRHQGRDAAPSRLQSYKQQLHSAAANKDVTRALALFEELRSDGLVADSAVYNCLLHTFVCADEFERAGAVMQEMRELGLLNIVSCNTMLKGFASVGNIESCRMLFAQIETYGLRPDAISYNCMIHATATAGDLQHAWSLVDQMQLKGVKCDEYTVCIMLMIMQTCRCTPQDVYRAFQLPKGLGIDICQRDILLCVAIKTCIQHDEVSRLENLIDGWEHKPVKSEPCLRVYVSLIRAYTFLQNVERCKELWREMTEERDMAPNCVVLGSMLHALVSVSLVDEAMALFENWKCVARSNMVIYATLLRGLATQGRAKDAMELFQELRSEPGQVTLNIRLYNPLLDAQARIGEVDEVHRLLEMMRADGVAPDSTSYAILVKGYCTSGKLDQAVDVVCNGAIGAMAGMPAHCGTYNTVLDICLRHRRTDLVDRLLADFEEKGIEASNFTLGIFTKAYGQQGQLDKAFSVARKAQKDHNLPFNLFLETCLMSACFHNSDAKRAIQVFDGMKAAVGDGLLDSKAFGVAIFGCARLGHTKEATRLVEEAYGLRGGKRMLLKHQNLLERDITFLMRALQQRNLTAEAMELYEKLHAAGVPVDKPAVAGLQCRRICGSTGSVSTTTAGSRESSPPDW